MVIFNSYVSLPEGTFPHICPDESTDYLSTVFFGIRTSSFKQDDVGWVWADVRIDAAGF